MVFEANLEELGKRQRARITAATIATRSNSQELQVPDQAINGNILSTWNTITVYLLLRVVATAIVYNLLARRVLCAGCPSGPSMDIWIQRRRNRRAVPANNKNNVSQHCLLGHEDWRFTIYHYYQDMKLLLQPYDFHWGRVFGSENPGWRYFLLVRDSWATWSWIFPRSSGL